MAIKVNKNIVIEDSSVALKDLVPKTTQTTSNTNTYSCNYVNEKLNDISSGFSVLNLNTLGATNSTNEITLGTYTIPSSGMYFFNARFETNYYGSSGRELWTYIKRNGSAMTQYNGVVNSYAYTLTRNMTIFDDCNAGDTITFTIKSGTTATYSCAGGQVRILKLK